jgi:hypothetical protein
LPTAIDEPTTKHDGGWASEAQNAAELHDALVSVSRLPVKTTAPDGTVKTQTDQPAGPEQVALEGMSGTVSVLRPSVGTWQVCVMLEQT